MPQRSRLTIQAIINDCQMASTSVRPPVKAKSLTLLELCETINELQQTSSRSTAQILTRRLYLHPLSISPNAKQHTSKIIANNLLQLEEPIPSKTPSPRSLPPFRGLSILSSSLPLIARTNGKSNISSFNVESEESTNTLGINAMSLPVIPRNTTALSSSSRKTTSTRSSFIAIQRKSKSTPPPPYPPEKIDVWRHLAQTLQRPPPKDPPTTPLDIHPHPPAPPPPIPNYIRIPTCESPIEEDD